MTTPNCQDVCGLVHQAALDLGLDIQDDAPSHEPIMQALDKMLAYLLGQQERLS